jgi:hypothetical protein
MVCAFFRKILILIIEKLSLLRRSWAFDIFPVVTLLGYFHIISIPILTFNERTMIIILEISLDRWNSSIIDGIVRNERSVFSENFIWRHIPNVIDSVNILIRIVGLKELVMGNVGHDSPG